MEQDGIVSRDGFGGIVTNIRIHAGGVVEILLVVIGGALTLAGTALAEFLKAREAGRGRRADRDVARRTYNRETLDKLQAAAGSYQQALVGYGDALRKDADIPVEVDQQLRSARVAFQSQLHRVDPSITAKFQSWETTAELASQGEGSASLEASQWKAAMKSCGEAVRRNL